MTFEVMLARHETAVRLCHNCWFVEWFAFNVSFGGEGYEVVLNDPMGRDARVTDGALGRRSGVPSPEQGSSHLLFTQSLSMSDGAESSHRPHLLHDPCTPVTQASLRTEELNSSLGSPPAPLGRASPLRAGPRLIDVPLSQSKALSLGPTSRRAARAGAVARGGRGSPRSARHAGQGVPSRRGGRPD